MKLKHPLFREGIEWCRLTDKERMGDDGKLKIWKYILLTDVYFQVMLPIRSRYSFVSGGQVWGKVTNAGITVMKGYAWNGCSFSPDWELLASLPHDLLYQFSGCDNYPETVIGRNFCDNLFYGLCVTKVGWAYRVGLGLGSWMCWDQIPANDDHIKVDKPWVIAQ